jgi:YHS domain-containing protein
MFRAVLELLFTIVVILVARAVLTSIMKGITNASQTAMRGEGPQPTAKRTPTNKGSGELHKDPVCGTYVAESTPFRRQAAGQSFYYCSEACREKHSLVAR